MDKVIADLEAVLAALKSLVTPAVDEVDQVVDTVAPDAVTESAPVA